MTPIEQKVVNVMKDWVREKFRGAPSSHAWDHTKRVYENAVKICAAEGGDEYIVSLAALFHDLGRIIEAQGGLYRGQPVKSFRGGHSALSLFAAKEKIDFLKRNEFLTRAQCAELRYIIYQHARLLKNSPRQTKNLLIVKDADMVDSFGYEGLVRNLSHSQLVHLPIWKDGLRLDLPEDRFFTIADWEDSGLCNMIAVYGFRYLLVFESSRKMAELKLQISGDFIGLFKQEIRNGNLRDYDFWLRFVRWAEGRKLARITRADLEEFESLA